MTDLFENNNSDPVVDPNKNWLEDLVGEGKKYKTVEDLARSRVEADSFIERLKNENAGIRNELNSRQNLESLIDKLSNSSPAPTDPNGNNQTPPKDGENKPLTQADIDRLVDSRLSLAEKNRIQNENLSLVRNTLSKQWGQDYLTNLKQNAAALGMSEDYARQMAMEQPKAFLALMGASKPQEQRSTNPLFVPPQSQQQPSRSQSFSPTNDRKMSYYEDLKKKNPSSYWSASVQNQMHNDAIKLGATFFDT